MRLCLRRPFRASVSWGHREPKALPWANLFGPFRPKPIAGDVHGTFAPKGLNRLALGNAQGEWMAKSTHALKGHHRTGFGFSIHIPSLTPPPARSPGFVSGRRVFSCPRYAVPSPRGRGASSRGIWAVSPRPGSWRQVPRKPARADYSHAIRTKNGLNSRSTAMVLEAPWPTWIS